MKLRLRSNSVRLRLTKTEVASMKDGGQCQEVVKFPGGHRLLYSLQGFAGPVMQVEMNQTTLNQTPLNQTPLNQTPLNQTRVTIRIPSEEVRSWSTSPSAVGIYASVDADGEPLLVSIEKDFQCLDAAPGEDQSDMFSNPSTGILSC